MTKTILLFGTGKSANSLIRYLDHQCAINQWHFRIADKDPQHAGANLKWAHGTESILLDVLQEAERQKHIQSSDLVISLLPPDLHVLVAKDCIRFSRNLLTASYVSGIQNLAEEVRKRGLIFLCEMGLDPGIDHMSAMRLIHGIERQGGKIRSFLSHCGGLMAPGSDNNPWHYKVSWNPRNIVRVGSQGARYLLDNKVRQVDYHEMFTQCAELQIAGHSRLAYYPNRDSTAYIEKYGLKDVKTFMRTTLRHPEFCVGWNALVNAGLTNEHDLFDEEPQTYRHWSRRILPWVERSNLDQLTFLGLFDDTLVPARLKNSAEVLQYLVESRLNMEPTDRDMILMVHEIMYALNDEQKYLRSSLTVYGDSQQDTAMAKTVGLPLGIAATMILKNELPVTGLVIPVIPEIYEPVLSALSTLGISFIEETI